MPLVKKYDMKLMLWEGYKNTQQTGGSWCLCFYNLRVLAIAPFIQSFKPAHLSGLQAHLQTFIGHIGHNIWGE